MSVFQTVISALNEGFIETLKLFFVTLVGSIPLGLIVCFGSMSRWAPLGFIGRRQNARRQALLHALEEGGKVVSGAGAGARELSEQQARALAKRLARGAKLFLGFRPISLLSRFVVWVIRGTPLMLQLLIVFYIPGYIFDNNPWSFPEGRFAAAAVMFIINYACYFSEIYRGGIQGVPVGQQEAGQVLGMTKGQIFFKVTLLQMVKRIVPGPHHLLPGGHLGRLRLPQGLARLFRPHLAAVFHRRLLSHLQRRRLLPAGQAGAAAGILPLRGAAA